MSTSIDTINYPKYATSGQNELFNAIKQSIASKNSTQHAMTRMLGELVDLYGDDTKKVYDNFALRVVEVYATLGADYSACEHFSSVVSVQIKRSIAKLLKCDVKVSAIYQMPKKSANGVKPPKFTPQHTLAIGDDLTRWIIGIQIENNVKKPLKDLVTDSVPVFTMQTHQEQFKQIGDLADTNEALAEKLKEMRAEMYNLREKRRKLVLKARKQAAEMRALKREKDALLAAASTVTTRKSSPRKPKATV